jgi:chromosome segregation ATPase
VTKWNERAEAVKNVITRAADRERAALETEREAIEKQRVQLDAERAAVGVGAEKAVNDYNTRAKALDARVVAWNQRNADFSERAKTLNADRDSWVAECAGRNYREIDEMVIKSGK